MFKLFFVRIQQLTTSSSPIFILALSLFLVLLVFFLVKGLNNNLIATYYKLKTSKINSKIRAVILTDLHSCYYGENQNDLFKKIEKEKPDLVFLVGDIIDDRLPEENGFIILRRLAAKYPSYYVTGNHEIYTEQIERIKEKISRLGIKILSGEEVKTKVNGNQISIKGIDDPVIGKAIYNEQLKNIQASTNDYFTILLAHHPERIADYNQIKHDLVISGHAHGGQFRLPYLLPGLYSPHQGIFPKYTSGFYELEKSTLLVSRGLSRESTLIPRFYNPPELIILDLIPAPKLD